MTNFRGLIRIGIEAYLNRHKTKYAPIKDVAASMKALKPYGDVYRNIYHIGLNTVGFDIVKDETTTYIRMV